MGERNYLETKAVFLAEKTPKKEVVVTPPLREDSLKVTENGTYQAPIGKGYTDVEVEVENQPILGTKSITSNGTYNAVDDELEGYSSVTVNVASTSKLPQVVDKTVTTIEAVDLSGATTIGSYGLYHLTNLVSLGLPEGITSIELRGIAEATSLTTLSLPSTLLTIKERGCSGMSSLTSVTVKEGLTSIGSQGFSYCNHLPSIILPTSLLEIGTSAFSGCSALTSITIKATNPPTLGGTNAFTGTNSALIIYVPSASVSAYQSATNWSNYSSRIQAIIS